MEKTETFRENVIIDKRTNKVLMTYRHWNLGRRKAKDIQSKASSLDGFEGSEGLDGSEGSVGPDGQLVQMVRKVQIAQCQGYLSRVEVAEGPYLLQTVQTV